MDYKTLMHSYICVFMTVFICGNQSVNYSTAVDKCKERNGLASYQHFMNFSRGRWDVNKYLRKGQSAWISGNVTFPDSFVRWHGCFENTKPGLHYHSLPSIGINECLQQCSKTTFNFIGIADSLCYCISKDHFKNNLLTLKNDSECKQKLFLLSVSQGKEEASDILQKAKIDVYEFITIDHARLTWTPSSNKSIGQCVYYMYDGIEEGYVTGSCNSKETGFMCTYDADGRSDANCSDDHSFYFHTQRFCYDSRPSTWKSSFTYCRRYSSNLPGLIKSNLRKNIKQKSKGNVAFWTGLFRIFNLSQFWDKKVYNESSVCLSIRNINNTSLFDPVECSSDKEYICEDDVSNNEMQTSYKTTDKTPFLSSKNTNGNIHRTPNPELSDYRDYLAIIVVLTIAFALLILICIIFRKNIKKLVCTYQVDTISKDIHETASTNNGVRLGSADNISNTHSNQSRNSEADYALASDDVPMSEAVESEYDRVNTRVSRKQVRDFVTFGNDANAYGVHTVILQEHDNDDYDHLEAHTSKHIKASADEIYNTMTEDNDTYNELKLKNSLNVEKPSKCIEKSGSTYDKLD